MAILECTVLYNTKYAHNSWLWFSKITLHVNNVYVVAGWCRAEALAKLLCPVGPRKNARQAMRTWLQQPFNTLCGQIGGSNNSIAAANSLTAGAWVQKSWIMQWRPAGICCPTAISFNIGQASVGITHLLNKSWRQLALLLYPVPSVWGINFGET